MDKQEKIVKKETEEKVDEYPKYDHYEKTAKQAATFLKRWNGGTAFLHELTVTHRILFIRIYNPQQPEWFLQLACSPEWIQSPGHWKNCQIEVKGKVKLKSGKDGFILLDKSVNMEIHTDNLESSEHSPKKQK